MKLHIFVLAAVAGLGVPAIARADAWFVRGDVNGLGTVNITDAIMIFQYLFTDGHAPIGCMKAADIDDSGAVDVTDGIRLLSFLFQGGPPPALPYPACGADVTEDLLDCVSVKACSGLGLIFVCDKSSSMNGAPFTDLKKVVLDDLGELGDSSLFAVIFFDSNMTLFPATGHLGTATLEMKTAAAAYVNAVTTGAGGCQKAALVKALTLALEASAQGVETRIIYLSDGGTTCAGYDSATYAAQTLAEVKARNTAGIPIDTICLGAPGTVDEAFMQSLAGQNGGGYTRIDD
jgi:hypothetical protein